MTSPELTVAFHIGAHKTATSHLQRSLREASDALADAGVQVYGPPDFRLPGRSIARLFGLHDAPQRTARRSPRDQLALLAKGAPRLVLSEENYIGPLNSPDGRPIRLRYPEAARRVAALSAAMDVGGIDILLGIRNPAHFLNSGYCQQLLGGQLIDMNRYKAQNDLTRLNWFTLVRRLRRAHGVRHLTVWRYEDYGALFPAICAALVGAAAASLVQPLPRRVHVGLSAKAVHRVLNPLREVPPERAAARARKRLPVCAENPPFDGFDPAEHAAAARCYAQQVQAIADLPGVTLLRP